MNPLPQKRALVTGAAMGLGKAVSDRLRAQNWHVVTVDREEGNGNHYQCDLADPAAVAQLLETLKTDEPFDMVVLNAAASASGRFEEMPLAAYEKLVELNAVTPMVMASGLAGAGKMAPGSHLVFVASLSHYVGYPGAAVYGATKDAIAVYARSIRKPFAKRGIAVSCVYPGPMKTAQAERHSPTGANADKRMDAEKAAALILKGVFSRKPVITPGGGARAFALFGRLLPSIADRAMRKIIYEKLDREVF